MKKILPLLIAAATFGAVAFLASCGKVKSLANINFDIPYNQQIAIPSSGYAYGAPLPAGGVNLPFPAVPVPTNSKQYIEQYHTSTDKILNVDLKSLSLQILSPAGQNFDFLDNVEVYVSTTGQPEVLLASQNAIAKGLTTLDLTTSTTTNLKPYFIADTLYFRLNAHINAVPVIGAQMQLSSVFHVLANPLY